MADLTWTGELEVTHEYLHHYAEAVLMRFPDIREHVLSGIAGPRTLDCQMRKRGGHQYLGVGTPSLNRSLKQTYLDAGQWRFEASVTDGVISDSVDLGAKVEGFDLARYDERHNLARMWSLCFGRRPLHGGQRKWAQLLRSRPEYEALAEDFEEEGEVGRNLRIEKVAPTILGEIQFGNWALAYRDLMKLLAATVEVEVDLYVYVTAAGTLADMISDNTVNFDNFRSILDTFSAVVTVPTWLVGIDFAEKPPTLEELTSPAPVGTPDS